MAPRSNRTHPVIGFLKNMINHGLENFGRYYSVYRGWVFDNQDPEKLGRVKLIVPSVTGPDFHDYWAFPKNIINGEGVAMQMIPPRGSVVWVTFEGGNPEVPVYEHGHLTRKTVIKDPELNDVNCYWFKTNRGHTVKINDTKNTIHIKSSMGDVVELNENGFSVVTKKAISLGTLNKSSRSAVLGEEIKDVLKDFLEVNNKLNSALIKDSAALTRAGMVNTLREQIKIKLILGALSTKIETILSKLVTLD